MSYRLLASAALVSAFALLGPAGHAGAATKIMLNGASSLVILAEDEENAEVQNLLEPETDGGQPGGGDSAATPDAAPGAGEEMKAKPEGANDEYKALEGEEK